MNHPDLEPAVLAHDDRDVLTLRELAERWRCSTRKIQQIVKARKLQVFRVGRLPRFCIFDVREYERQGRTRTRKF